MLRLNRELAAAYAQGEVCVAVVATLLAHAWSADIFQVELLSGRVFGASRMQVAALLALSQSTALSRLTRIHTVVSEVVARLIITSGVLRRPGVARVQGKLTLLTVNSEAELARLLGTLAAVNGGGVV